jgi:hypothetical protein
MYAIQKIKKQKTNINGTYGGNSGGYIITFRFSSKTFKVRNIVEQMDNIPCE